MSSMTRLLIISLSCIILLLTSAIVTAAGPTTEWSYQLGKPGQSGAYISASPIYNNGIVYVCSYDGVIYAVQAQNGAPLWKFDVGTTVYSTPVFQG